MRLEDTFRQNDFHGATLFLLFFSYNFFCQGNLYDYSRYYDVHICQVKNFATLCSIGV